MQFGNDFYYVQRIVQIKAVMQGKFIAVSYTLRTY